MALRGFGGIPIHVSAGDQRVCVSFGRRAKTSQPPARRCLRSTARASRSSGEAPARQGAAVRRDYAVEYDGRRRQRAWPGAGSPRLGPGPVCHVGYVDAHANPHADEVARTIADKHARAFRCGGGRPVILGKRGAGLQWFGKRLGRLSPARRRQPCRAPWLRSARTSGPRRGRRVRDRIPSPARCRRAPTPPGSSSRSG
jgi:hypothetical protein